MLILGAAGLLQGCATENVTEVVVAAVSVLPGSTAVGTGSTVRFEATVSEAGGTPLTGVVVTWSTSAPDVVSIDQTGLARAISAGAAIVAASFHGIVGQATVAVLAPAGVTFAETNGSTTVRESGTRDSLTLVLDAMPSADVGLLVTSLDASEATVSPSTLRFTPSTWSTPRTVVVTGVDDVTVDGGQTVLVRVSVEGAPGSAYAAVEEQSISVVVLDDDIADFYLVESDGKTSAREGSAPDTIAVVLAAQPLSEVVFAVSSDDTTDAKLNPTRLTFTPSTWDIPQAVTFTAVDDHVRDGKRSRTVTVAVLDHASDRAFRGLRRSVIATTHDEKKRLSESLAAAWIAPW